MALIDRVLGYLRDQLEEGVKEATGANDGIPSTRYMGGRREPWCGHLVATAFRVSGYPLPGDVVPTPETANPIASVAEMERQFAARMWCRQGPLRGDVVFFAHRGGSDPGHGRHTGVIERLNNTTITVLEGNAGNRVARVTYLRMKLNGLVTSYGRVPEQP